MADAGGHLFEQRQLGADIGEKVLLKSEGRAREPPKTHQERGEMPPCDADGFDVEHHGIARQHRLIEHVETRIEIDGLAPGEERSRPPQLGRETQLTRPDHARAPHCHPL